MHSRRFRKCETTVLVKIISNHYNFWRDGRMDQHLPNESISGPYQRLDVPDLSLMSAPGVSDSCSQMFSDCWWSVQKRTVLLCLGHLMSLARNEESEKLQKNVTCPWHGLWRNVLYAIMTIAHVFGYWGFYYFTGSHTAGGGLASPVS